MKSIFSAAVATLLALSLLANPASAQRRGGGGRSYSGGGRSFSGARTYGGGYRGGTYRGGGAYYRGGGNYYRGGGYYRGGYGSYGYRGYGWGGLGMGLGWPYYYGGSYAYPYYYDNYSYPYVQTPLLYEGTTVPYVTPPVIIGAQQSVDNAVQSTQGSNTAVAGAGVNNNATQSFYSGPPAQGQAELVVKVPNSDAQVSLGSILSEQSGTERQFYFPSLSDDVSFTVRCQWSENGKMVVREKQVVMHPGQTATVDFSKA